MAARRGPIRRSACWLTLAALPLVACLGGPAPRDHFYRLETSQPAHVLPQPVLKGTLEIERLRGDTLTRERSILRVESASSVQVAPYTYHLWVDTPTTMLQRNLAEFLRQAGVAERIVLPEMDVQEQYELRGWIERLVRVTESGAVVVEIEFSLSRARGGGQLMRKRYRAEEAAAGSDMDAAVRAFSAAVSQIFQQLQADIVAAAG